MEKIIQRAMRRLFNVIERKHNDDIFIERLWKLSVVVYQCYPYYFGLNIKIPQTYLVQLFPFLKWNEYMSWPSIEYCNHTSKPISIIQWSVIKDEMNNGKIFWITESGVPNFNIGLQKMLLGDMEKLHSNIEDSINWFGSDEFFSAFAMLLV